MESQEISFVSRQFTLEEWNEREYELAEKAEELESQKEMLNAAVEELISKNEYLSQALTELSKRKYELDQLIYRLSHDLRTPVTSILGVCHIMQLDGLPKAFNFHLDHIQKKTVEMDTVLKSLATFSQVAFDGLRPEKVQVAGVLREVLENLKSDGVADNAEIVLTETGDSIVWVDADKLSLLFHHVIKNAFDFRTLTGQARVKLHTNISESGLEFTCTDNGVGIEEAIKPNIFDMFYRGSSRSTGSGLGLYIVKEIVQRLNGSIEVTSRPGQTDFIIFIPHAVVA